MGMLTAIMIKIHDRIVDLMETYLGTHNNMMPSPVKVRGKNEKNKVVAGSWKIDR
ncbi:MAG: hypothetical protein KA369_10475 [Spirochaetes bacterium]|nr:hypothetical protein [Spirochaetota bacterium]